EVAIATIIGQPLNNLPSIDSISKAAAQYVGMFAFLMFIPKIISNEIKNGSTTSFNLLDLLLVINSFNDSEEYIEGEQPMNDEEIEANLAEVTATSIETTTSALCFPVYNVTKNPLTLEKLRAEIFKVFGSDTTLTITFEALESCRYLDALIKEMLRHSNPGPFTLRVLDGYENVGDYHWSPGTWFFVDNHRIMNNPIYWNEPMKFRFLIEEHGGT
ncbi:16663_t:CDS:2, partial [Dentiscutata heterogama]